jgi:choline dehydrogenase-like flavoprotein
VDEIAATARSLLEEGSGLGLLTIDQPTVGVGDGVGVGVGVGVGDGFGRAWDATTAVGRDARIVRTAATTIKSSTRRSLIGSASLSTDAITMPPQAERRGKAG